MITDAAGRHFKKLRVSLTHECNYACVYCVDGNKLDVASSEPMPTGLFKAQKLLSSSELIEIIRKLHTELGLNAVRLTGGEPLLYPRLRSIVASIFDMGIANIGMTTNGHMLRSKAKILFESGLTSVNISLDAISSGIFKQMSLRHGLPNVLSAIDACLGTGLHVKINTVIVAGKNDIEILPLLDFALNKQIVIRFLELMPMGPLHRNMKEMFFSSAQILDAIKSKYTIEKLPREGGATSHYWSINGRKAFGIIANDSAPFCSDCNRLRLDSYGNIYGCLSSLIPIQVSSGITKDEMQSALKRALTHKQPTHFVGNQRTMQSIGG